jgi:hypothetical protein
VRSKLKAYPRKEKARITGDVLRAIGAGLSQITAQNCAARVEHDCKYNKGLKNTQIDEI